MSDLKPCPFCGKEPNQKGTELGDRPCFYFECENPKCGAAEMGWHDTEQEAIDAWNTRPIEDALQARIDELEAGNLKIKTDNAFNKDAFRCFIDRIHKFEEDAKYMSIDIEHCNTRIAELEKAAVKWHKYPDEKPPIDGRYLFWDSDGNAPHVLPYNDIVVRNNPGVFSTQTHWAYLPAPPKEEG